MKYGFIVLLLLVFIKSSGQQQIDLKVKSIKTTLLELGNVNTEFSLNEYKKQYKKARFIFCIQNSYIVIISKSKTDTIYLEKRKIIGGVLDNEYLRKYPTENLEECIESKVKNCSISRTLQSILEQKSDDIYYSIGRGADFAETNRVYFLFCLANNRLALLSLNEFIIINFKM